MRSETRVSVTDDFLGKAEPSEYVFQIEFCYACAGNGSGAGEEYCSSGTSVVYDGKDGIMSVTFRESCDKVHRYVREWLGINGRGDVKEWGFDVVC